MEGFRDIVWAGDQIVWINLFKNFVYCLNMAFFDIEVFGDQIPYEVDRIPYWGRWDEPPTPQFDELFNAIWEDAKTHCKLIDLADELTKSGRKCRAIDLIFYLNNIKLTIMDVIENVYIDRGLKQVGTESGETIPRRRLILTDTPFFENLPKVEEQHEGFTDVMFSISDHMTRSMYLGHLYNMRNAGDSTYRRNRFWLMSDFTTDYVRQLEQLMWPKWYTACFSRSDANSSMWGNYADNHSGICLIFEAEDGTDGETIQLNKITGYGSTRDDETREHWDFVPMHLRDVNYAAKPGEVDFFRSVGLLPLSALMKLWYTDDNGHKSDCASHIKDSASQEDWRNSYFEAFQRDISIKTKDWQHEQECRLILFSMLDDLAESRKRALRYEFQSLKGIIFGIRTTNDDKIKIMEILEPKILDSRRTDFKFYQAYYAAEEGEIQKYELDIRFADNSVENT